MYDPMQSVYRLVHSTETALVKINYDMLSSFDTGKCTALVYLDLSAAFDTINHNVLLNRLHYLMGAPILHLNGFSRTLNRETTILCWRLPFTKTASNVRHTTGFSVGCQTVYHVHQGRRKHFDIGGAKS